MSAAAFRRGTTALVVLLASDLALVVVTGSTSLLALGLVPVGGVGFALRAAVLGVLLVVRFRRLAPREARASGARLLLVLLFLPTLVQFHLVGARLAGVDAISYYVFLRSMVKDRDYNLVNEYEHYGMLARRDLAVTTKTGHRRSIYSVGPAVAWMPFFFLGEGVARAQARLGGEADLSGYGPAHRNAVALGSLLYGFAAILLVQALLARHFGEWTALGAALLVWGTTFFHFYLVFQPTYAHSASTLLAAYALWLWDRGRANRDAWGYFFLGVILGFAVCVRWQNGVLLILPGIEVLVRLRHEPATLARLVGCGGLLLSGTFLGAFPQMTAWKALYDMWILPYPPQGTDFMRFDHPWILETLFSSRHGLLSWTPALWVAFLGFLPLLKRRRELALLLLPPLVLMTYVNMCVGDWWGGASFSNRRFDSLLPVLAFGFAASIDVARTFVRSHPRVVLALVALPAAAWNVTLVEQVRRGLVAADRTVAFPTLAGGSARIVTEAAGFPTTWPASWLFARRHRLPPARYESLVGRYLFYRQNSLGGRIDLGSPGDGLLLGEGWGLPEVRGGASARPLEGRARLFVPLDVPEDLDIRFRAAVDQDRDVRVLVNGREAGRFHAGPDWGVAVVRAPSGLWHRELNEVAVDAGGDTVWVDAVELVRPPKKKATG